MSDDDTEESVDDADEAVDEWMADVAEEPDTQTKREREAAGDDPFRTMDTGDREGDPFEALDADEGAAQADGAAADADPLADAATDADPLADVADPDDRPPELEAGEDPFEDMAGEARAGDPFEGGQSAFDAAGAERADPDGVWERMEAEEDVDATPLEQGKRYVEVSKHSYCERCEYFSPPPDVHCGHEGTEILEFVDMETVRVVDCPVVAERRAIEREH